MFLKRCCMAARVVPMFHRSHAHRLARIGVSLVVTGVTDLWHFDRKPHLELLLKASNSVEYRALSLVLCCNVCWTSTCLSFSMKGYVKLAASSMKVKTSW